MQVHADTSFEEQYGLYVVQDCSKIIAIDPCARRTEERKKMGYQRLTLFHRISIAIG